MSTRQKLFCTLSILLSLGVLTLALHYFKAYSSFFIIAMLVIIRLNIFIFTPRKRNSSL